MSKRDASLGHDTMRTVRTKPDWQQVEEAVFRHPAIFGPDCERAVHWSDMGFDECMDAGFIQLYPEARMCTAIAVYHKIVC